MNTKRRLFKLETGPTLEADRKHLVRLLGSIDGTCWPVRHAGSHRRFNAESAACREACECGMSFVLDGRNAQSWKQSERARAAMQAAGWITIGPGAKCKPTLAGDCLARSLVGLPTLKSLPVVLAFSLIDEKLTPETEVFGSVTADDWRQQAMEIVMPLVVHGFVQSISSSVGNVSFRKLKNELPADDELPRAEYDSGLADIYTASFIEALHGRRQFAADPSEVFIPAPASL